MTSMDEKIDRPRWPFGCTAEMTPRDIRNRRRFSLLMLGWGVAWCAARLGLGEHGLQSPAPRVALALLPIAVLLAALAAYLRFLRHADELLRRIEVEGLGVGFATGLLLLWSWLFLERLGAGPIDPTVVGSLMVFGWVAGQHLARRRYT